MDWIGEVVGAAALVASIAMKVGLKRFIKDLQEALVALRLVADHHKAAMADGRYSEQEIRDQALAIQKAIKEVDDVVQGGAKIWKSLRKK